MSGNVVCHPQFRKRVEEWKSMDRTNQQAQDEAFTFYNEQIFPRVKEVFLSKSENRPQKNYDALILTVGTSPEPLILSILAIQPQQVGLLHTPATAEFLQRIQDETGLTAAQLDKREIDGSSVVEIYEAIMSLYRQWRSPVNLAVDITGGKKSMVSGATMAGAVLGADIYYVDNTSYTRILGKPEPGSEYLSLFDNPYTVFGDLEVEKARGLYNRYDYAGAQRIFNQIAEQVRDPSQEIIYKAYEFLCKTYEAWDNVNIGGAKGDLAQLLDILNRYTTVHGLVPLRNLEETFRQQKEALECLEKIFNDKRLALDIHKGFHFAFMLHHNACRREAQEKLDMACLILYRLLEWIGQHRLAIYGIDTSKPDYSKCGISADQLFQKYKQKRKGVYGKADMSALPDPIALVDGFLILDVLGDGIVDGLNWGAFRGQVGIRNQSIYAHGMRKINPNSFQAFKSTVETRFEKAQEIADIDADAFNRQHEFIAALP